MLHREAEAEVTFNFDENLRRPPELHPMIFVRDLEAFSRAPDWLRETVERGLELQRAHEASVADQQAGRALPPLPTLPQGWSRLVVRAKMIGMFCPC